MRTQTDDFIISFFFFEFKPRFHQKIILQILRYTFFNTKLIPHRTNANVIVINNSNKWSLSDPIGESKDSDF
jgi:hypothetical protein